MRGVSILPTIDNVKIKDEYLNGAYSELAALLGVSESTVRRSLTILHRNNFVWWRKATYKGANRYFLHDGIMEALRPSSIRSN